MNMYWLYINSYTFIWNNESKGIVYNAKNYKYFHFTLSEILESLIHQLNCIENMYCIVLSENDINHLNVKKFIEKLVHIQSGLLLNTSEYSQKPVSFYPQVKIMKRENENLTTVLNKFLTSVLIYINGKCKLDCKGCLKIFKQTRYCTKSNYELSVGDLKIVLDQLKKFNLKQINFSGGNIFEHSEFDEFMNLLNDYSFESVLYIHYEIVINNLSLLINKLKRKIFRLTILVNSSIHLEIVKILNDCLSQFEVNWIFVFSETIEFHKIKGMIKFNRLKSIQLTPFFNSENLSFFKENVFLTKNDILNNKLRKQDVFINQVLNRIDFGKLYILSNKEVFTNLNLPSIGYIYEPIYNLILKELNSSNSWLKTRANVVPCKSCIYKYLCPPISNYEHVLGKNNLCNIRNYNSILNLKLC